MGSFEEKLNTLLKTDKRFLDKEGELHKGNVVDAAYKADRALVELLLETEDTKKKFFGEIKGHSVFDINTFVAYIQDKNFLNDSYTRFKNKIGLNIDGKFLNERGEVALVWPFKDCVLEGGMTKEDEKRKEIFFNEILAQDEIDKLFAPKVLINWKRYTAKGEEKVGTLKRADDGTLKENLLIKGNNLLALHTLKEQFQGKVKLIYIDPPYNRDADTFYNDSFKHSTWLTFMKNRLEVAQNLLIDDGVVFVQCDDNEQAYLKVLMDEVFKRENFLNCIAVKMSTSAGLKMSHKTKKLLKIKEYILVYTKKNTSFELSNIDELYVDKDKYETERSDKYIVNFQDNYSHWKLISLHQAYKKYARNGQEKMEFVNENCHRIFNHVTNPSTKKAWDKLSAQEKVKYKDKVRKYDVDGSDYQYAFNDHVLIPYNPKNFDGDFWTQNYSIGGTKTDEGGVEFKNGKKREILLKRIISLTTNIGDIILDYHLGSGTTCAVAHKMRRQYIGIEQLDYEQNGSVARLKNVIAGDESGISKNVGWKGGGDFIYCELMKYNEGFMEEIEEAKDTRALLRVWGNMKERSFFNFNVDLKAFEENLPEFKKLALEKQKETLCSLLNKNQLYVNKSEIEDKDFKVGKEDKEMNKEFYGR
ncbi:MAG: hypothetical protein A3C08_02565 [Candidatus Taylorbacteria bacterium RIFCSPHIGHO2_02_FULL_47_18]|nr:MAG: hypothetical protein A2670_02275 [Candidatus Taylorbacteria bacterium RIFCSPHIGHO2_01_FULL_48_38]OHA27583.1 MAG: hypothetical protein A3C08_02565 [Candidatus Taylorbacteria bacterium RIFCSPHIGHO2_02_FULL_47_18]OHA40430.1 MAG: hypothetical protein A3J31_02585 [Candidatus Taylorbacteria bacterium RIFCSPLOWO2_02_FULL_48_16]OHA44930.1 MAG: hypothetical protein A3H13_03440 [Candidatus Taylorbacteria bacterium RIFCSPLOWO2_12_FULL_48_11]